MASTAGARWTAALRALAIPEDILRAAPESPHGFPPRLFRTAAEAAMRSPSGPSFERALEALRDGGTVLDVGVGGGAAGLPLAPPATLVTGVDSSEPMLAQFARAADARGIEHREVLGEWPDVARTVDRADVVVCHHVFYNAPDLVRFARALTDKARRRVVVELTARHPMVELNDLWLHFHGLKRPEGPVAEDAIAVLGELGLVVSQKRCAGPRLFRAALADRVAFTRKRLCLGPDRDAELAALLRHRPAERELVTLWWTP
jgi:SAM-dependent methyltransferase